MNLKTHSTRNTPLAYSWISAGAGADIGEDYRLLDINELVTNGREGFAAYEVTGNSMVDHIQPGNLVFVDTWAEPKNGDIIASSVNGDTCVKIFQSGTRGLFLISSNKAYTPREITSNDQFHVLGVIRGHLGLHR